MEFETFQICSISDTYVIVRAVLCSIIAVPAIFGNVLILVGVCKMKKTGAGRAYFILIANLAVTDILLGLCMLLYPLEEIFPQLSEMRYFCLIRLSTIASLFACTGATLIIIATRRLICVIFPLQERIYRTNLDRILYVVLVIEWIGFFTVGYIPMMGLNSYDKGLDVKCENGDIGPIGFFSLFAILVLVFLVYNTVLYIVLMYVLVRRAMFKDKHFTRTGVMALVFLVFTVCWLPYVILSLISFWKRDNYCNIEYAMIPGYLNAALNWIVYGATNSKFMRTVREMKLFNCVINKNKRDESVPNATTTDTSSGSQYNDDTSTI